MFQNLKKWRTDNKVLFGVILCVFAIFSYTHIKTIENERAMCDRNNVNREVEISNLSYDLELAQAGLTSTSPTVRAFFKRKIPLLEQSRRDTQKTVVNCSNEIPYLGSTL